ncbi:MAG TPA: hypothetical protein VG944_23520 [Fimbriimonas sp.]|nr:hypothetical protein [Fimbriimonas sp.]
MNDEKKKLAIVGALVAVMACVGAFQLLGGKKAPPPPPVTETPKPTTVATAKKPATAPKETNPDGTPAAVPNPEVANDLPVRDPFKPPPGALPPSPPPGGIPPMKSNFHPPITRGPKPFPTGLGPGPLPGNFGGPGGTVITPTVPAEHPFGYRLVGEIGGERPAALFEDSAGNQKLVGLGSRIDGDTTLKSMGKESVIIEFRGGKKLRVSMGGTPVGK